MEWLWFAWCLILFVLYVVAFEGRKHWQKKALDYKKSYDCAVAETRDIREAASTYLRLLKEKIAKHEQTILDLQGALDVREKLHDELCSKNQLSDLGS